LPRNSSGGWVSRHDRGEQHVKADERSLALVEEPHQQRRDERSETTVAWENVSGAAGEGDHAGEDDDRREQRSASRTSAAASGEGQTISGATVLNERELDLRPNGKGNCLPGPWRWAKSTPRFT
jgi:hypothetical protein